MRVTRILASGRERSGNEIFKGRVDYQTIVGDDVGKDLSMSEVHFIDGARNRWHMHSTDQILLITDGEGIVADEAEERTVSAGEVALIPRNTKHWHGAKPGKDMTHLSILAAAKTAIVGD